MRILYGIGGEGNGHAMRSRAVIEYLLRKGHTIEICTSGIGPDVLGHLAPVHQLPRVPLVYRNGSLAYARSSAKILAILRFWPRTLRTLGTICDRFKPDLIISDYETFTAFYGQVNGIPVIAANNISVIDRAQVVPPYRKNFVERLWPRIVEPLATWHPDWYVIPTFFRARPTKNHVTLAPPPIREAIQTLTPTRGTHILVYQTSATHTRLLEALRQTKHEYHIYGYGKRRQEKNLHFYAFNEREFLTQLASAKAVILGGGFTLITEALYLQKPILSVPVRHHYEQCFNAAMVARTGTGRMSLEPTADEIDAFVKGAGSFKTQRWDPDAYAKAIEKIAKKLVR